MGLEEVLVPHAPWGGGGEPRATEVAGIGRAGGDESWVDGRGSGVRLDFN